MENNRSCSALNAHCKCDCDFQTWKWNVTGWEFGLLLLFFVTLQVASGMATGNCSGSYLWLIKLRVKYYKGCFMQLFSVTLQVARRMAMGNGSGCMLLTHSSQLRGRRRRCHHNFISGPFLPFSGTETFFGKSQILNVFPWNSVTSLGQLRPLDANMISKLCECIQTFRYFEETKLHCFSNSLEFKLN